MSGMAKMDRDLARRAGAKSGPWSKVAKGGAVLGMGALGVLLGGLPFLAAKRVLHPVWAQPQPGMEPGVLTLDLPVVGEAVEYVAADGVTVCGWFVPGPSDTKKPWPCVLLVYGYGGFKEQMSGYVKLLYEGGFSTFLFDMQGTGSRKGAPVSFGHREQDDMLDALKYLRTRPDVDPRRLGVLGVSMGAATALLAAARDKGVKAVVADSSYADLTCMIAPGVSAFVGRKAVWIAPIIVRYAEMMLGMRSSQIRPAEAASRLGERPLLVIHGESDSLIDIDSADRIYKAASGPKEIWTVPDCDHAYAPVVAADEYKRRVNGFFQKYLGTGL